MKKYADLKSSRTNEEHDQYGEWCYNEDVYLNASDSDYEESYRKGIYCGDSFNIAGHKLPIDFLFDKSELQGYDACANSADALTRKKARNEDGSKSVLG